MEEFEAAWRTVVVGILRAVLAGGGLVMPFSGSGRPVDCVAAPRGGPDGPDGADDRSIAMPSTCCDSRALIMRSGLGRRRLGAVAVSNPPVAKSHPQCSDGDSRGGYGGGWLGQQAITAGAGWARASAWRSCVAPWPVTFFS